MAKKPAPPAPPRKRERIKKDPNSRTSRRAASKTADNLRDDAKAFRDRFILEYLRDFNATQAYIRAGGTSARPTKAGYEIKCEAYVAKAIADAIDALDEAAVTTRQRILAGLVREANHVGGDSSHGARVTAWSKLAGLMGLEAPQVEAAQALRGGVLIVPATQKVDDWEKRSAAAQQALKDEVKK